MPDIAQIDPSQVMLIAAVVVAAIVGAEKFVSAGASLKERFVDSRQKRLVDAAIAGDGSLREEIMAMFGEAHSEHERYDRQFANDKRALERIERDVDELKLKTLLHDAQIAEHRDEGDRAHQIREGHAERAARPQRRDRCHRRGERDRPVPYREKEQP